MTSLRLTFEPRWDAYVIAHMRMVFLAHPEPTRIIRNVRKLWRSRMELVSHAMCHDEGHCIDPHGAYSTARGASNWPVSRIPHVHCKGTTHIELNNQRYRWVEMLYEQALRKRDIRGWWRGFSRRKSWLTESPRNRYRHSFNLILIGWCPDDTTFRNEQ
jgi:hypothetical protein